MPNAFVDRFIRRPPGREARNEQTKALAAIANAVAIALAAAGLVGPHINGDLARLSLLERAGFVVAAALAHLIARAILWSIEDR